MGGGYACGDKGHISVSSPQFHSESKTALKGNLLEKQKSMPKTYCSFIF